MKDRLGIFVFYDKQGIVDSYIEVLLKSILEVVQELVIICNGYISERGEKILKNYSQYIYIRENKGFDAGAWKDAFLQYIGWNKIKNYDEIILLNDTFYGPFDSFIPMFQFMDNNNEIDFWGITEHYETLDIDKICMYKERPRHLQTYFIVLRKSLFCTIDFQEYWEEMPYYSSLSEVINQHEVVFTKWFEDLGYKSGVYINTTDLKADKIECNYNLYALACLELMKNRKLNILKKKNLSTEKEDMLFVSNGEYAIEYIDWIKENTNYDISLIWENLLRTCNIRKLFESLHLEYIISDKRFNKDKEECLYKKVALFINIYHFDKSKEYLNILNKLKNVDVYFFLQKEIEKSKIEEIINCIKQIIIIKEQEPMILFYDKIIPLTRKYDYFGYIHDKVYFNHELETIGISYNKLNWNNFLYNSYYVENIVQLFEENKNLGCLLIPEISLGNCFYKIGDKWGDTYKISKKIYDILGLTVNFSEEIKPLSTNGVFWAKTKAVEKLEKIDIILENKNIEDGLYKILVYVIQENGYYTGYLMNKYFAELEISNLRYMLKNITEYNFKIVRVKNISFKNFYIILKKRLDTYIKYFTKFLNIKKKLH